MGLIIISAPLNAWHNWTGNHQAHGIMHYPTTKDELIAIITTTAHQNKKISVIGAGYSLNDIVCGNDVLISMNNFTAITNIDYATKQVTAQAGISLQQLSRHIAQHGLALPNLPSIAQITLAGAASTASHGTGHTGTLSSFITQIELITADGAEYQLSENTDKEAFQAACVSLGALGVMYSITLQCEPIFKLNYQKISMSLDAMVEQYEQLQQINDFFQFRWNTQTNLVIAEFWNRVSLDTPPSESVQYSFETLCHEKDNASIRTVASEIAVPAHLFKTAVFLIKDFLKKCNQRGVEIPQINVRFVNSDAQGYLSPCASWDAVYFNMSHPVNPRYYQVYNEFEQLMLPLSGRPHWGKNHFMNYEKTVSLYGDNFLQFIEVKKRLDPHNIFSNDYINRIVVPSLL